MIRRILSAHNGPDFSNLISKLSSVANSDVCFRMNSTVCCAKLLLVD